MSYVQYAAAQLSEVAIVRIVDKSPGTMWGFCKKWVWDWTTSFLHAEKYVPIDGRHTDLLVGFHDLLSQRGWECNPRARLALLYLIGKSKSLCLPQITWRPICAQCAPVLPCWKLRIATKAFTCLQKFLASSSNNSGNSSPSKSRSSPPPHPPTNPEGVVFLLASTLAWMEAAETIRGQLAAAHGLVRFQLQGTNPNAPFDSVLPHVGSVLQLHSRVQVHYTPACVAAAATDQGIRL